MDSGGEGSISWKDLAIDAPAVANGGMILDHFLDTNLDEILDGMTVDELLDDLNKQLLVPVAVPEGHADPVQSGIIPALGEAEVGQKRKRKEAAGELAEQKPKRKKVVSWTEDDHRMFLLGLRFIPILAKIWKSTGIHPTEKWKIMSTYFLPNKDTREIASHAQKYSKRQHQKGQTKRKSINDTILRKEDEVRLINLILENLKARKRLQLSQPGAAPTVVQSQAGQFRQVPEACFPAGQVQYHLNQMPVMGALAYPGPSFGVCDQTHQMKPTPSVTQSCACTRPHIQSPIIQEFQPAPTAQPMVRPHLLNGATTLMSPVMGWDGYSIQAFNISGGAIPEYPVAEYQQLQPSFYNS
ncbi:hypothetical protein CDL15_Pgr020997 [Punica granatum]|uniref:Uncharacterized protein n=1 Tax=Punica granatum TaxID=22663 RepID=A0A218Y2C2_PUNGR|nr:hypothetical protein CDL15_Pgr020997 [Punica granatum]